MSIVKPRSGAAARCQAWLEEKLADGPVASSEIYREATELGISKGTLWRVANRLGVQSEREAKWTPGSFWSRPPGGK